jgi:TatD DNase family protein
MFVDTHCHLDFEQFDFDRDLILGRLKEDGIDYIVNVGSTLKGSFDSVTMAQQYDQVYAAVGIHPHDADDASRQVIDQLKVLAQNKKVVAIGETGLDFFKNFSKKENQMALFPSLILLAKERGLPLIIHSRQASLDPLKIMRQHMPLSAVIHCFSGEMSFLKECLDLGFSVTFTGNITYKKADNLRELVRFAPLERIFLETDAPYLAPEGMRGKRNEPARVKSVAEEISRIKGISLEEVARVTTQSAKSFFKIG